MLRLTGSFFFKHTYIRAIHSCLHIAGFTTSVISFVTHTGIHTYTLLWLQNFPNQTLEVHADAFL